MPVLTPEEVSRQEYEAYAQDAAVAERDKAEYEAYVKEIQGGGAIRRETYKSTGIGATLGATGAAAASAVVPALTPTTPYNVLGGAVLGEAAEQGLYQLTSPGPETGIPIKERAEAFGQQAAFAVAGEVGAGAIRYVRPVQYAAARTLTPEQIARKHTLDQSHIPYLPHEITGSGWHKMMADIAESGMLSRPMMDEFKRDQNVMRKIAVQSIANDIGKLVPPDELAVQVVKVIKDEREVADTIIGMYYNEIRDTLKYETSQVKVPTGKQIPTGVLDAQGKPVVQPEMTTKSVTSGGLVVNLEKSVNAFSDAKQRIEQAAENLNLPDLTNQPWYQTVSKYAGMNDTGQWNDAYEALKSVRLELRRVQEAKSAGVDTSKMADVSVLKGLDASLSSDLEGALRTSTNPAHTNTLALWQTAQRERAVTSQKFRNDIVESFITTLRDHGGEPAVAKMLLQSSPEDVQKMMTATASNPTVQNSLRRSFIEEGFNRSGGRAGVEGGEDVFDPKKFRQFMFGKSEFTARKTDVLFTPEQQSQFGEFITAVEEQMAMSKTGKTGAVFLAMKQSGAFFTIPAASLATLGIYSGARGDQLTAAGELGGAVSVFMAPTWIAQALTDKRKAGFLIQGLKYSAVNESQTLRVTRELMRVDQVFARSVQIAASQIAPGLTPTRTAEETQLQTSPMTVQPFAPQP